MKAVIIGCGPAGLAAAHAAHGLGCDIEIIAPKQKTPQKGPIFLNTPIPGISTDHPQGFIKQLVIGGSIVDYGIKLYGDVNIGITRDGQLREGIHTWDIREAYAKMWAMYHPFIVSYMVRPDEIRSLCDSVDLVISTAPANSLCIKNHEFVSQAVAMAPRAAYDGQPDNTVIFNAYPDIPWVRSARMFGKYESTEYMLSNLPAGEEYRIIRKPIRTDCDCHPRLFRTGRFGKWDNMAWIDTAYYDVRTLIISMRHQDEWDQIR